MAGRTTDPEKLRRARKAFIDKRNQKPKVHTTYISYPQPEAVEVHRAASIKACDMARGETHSEVLEEARLFLSMLGLL